jgi:hypothetical protein
MSPTGRGKNPGIGAEQKDQGHQGVLFGGGECDQILACQAFRFQAYACFVLHLKRKVARRPFRRSLDN